MTRLRFQSTSFHHFLIFTDDTTVSLKVNDNILTFSLILIISECQQSKLGMNCEEKGTIPTSKNNEGVKGQNSEFTPRREFKRKRRKVRYFSSDDNYLRNLLDV